MILGPWYDLRSFCYHSVRLGQSGTCIPGVNSGEYQMINFKGSKQNYRRVKIRNNEPLLRFSFICQWRSKGSPLRRRVMEYLGLISLLYLSVSLLRWLLIPYNGTRQHRSSSNYPFPLETLVTDFTLALNPSPSSVPKRSLLK